MSEEKRETKEALLGELESIKDLLSEDEWDDIPVLNDAISAPSSAVADESPDDVAADTATTAEKPNTSSPSVEHQLDLMGAAAEDIAAFPEDNSDSLSDPIATESTSTSDVPPIIAPVDDDFNLAAAHIDTPPASDSFGGAPIADAPTARSTQPRGLDASQSTDIDAAVDKLDLDLSLDYDDEENLLLDQGFEESSDFSAPNYGDPTSNHLATDGDELEETFDHANAADKEFDSSDLDLDLDLDLGESEPESLLQTPSESGEQTDGLSSTTEYETPVANLDGEHLANLSEEPSTGADDTSSAEEPFTGLNQEPLADLNEKPLVGLDEEPLADLNEEPSAAFDEEPSADLHEELSADLDEEPSAGLNEKPSANLNEEPSAGLHDEPSAGLHEEPAADLLATDETATPDIAELVHDLEALDQSMMDVDINITDEASSAADDHSESDTANTSEDSALVSEDLDSAEIPVEDSNTPEIIENSEFAKATPSEVEEYQHDAFAHLAAGEEPLSPFGPAGISAIASLSKDYPQHSHDGDSSVNISQTDPNLPPGVLPGQQSLFSGEAKNAKSHQGTSHSRAERPTKASGENPFLPKHIRDRLHTNKALVDIIKESPLPPPTATRPLSNQIHESVKQQLPPELSAERLHDMVEEVMALYMPRIEAELRERLLNEIKLIEPSTDSNEEVTLETPTAEEQNLGHDTGADSD